ncbi:GDP-D-glucose phosphorylase 1-like isoform X2 [Varroa jacobsoni]|uniref:GDP-D-glucose phosphorylase 1-like isoform X2 n=1 Tax=Varroa jacobsoni TaxID=62625 RepID=UPI000BF43EC2|nr:GDP-D-glucose phosphorylase 1-like isoform X2 [Varroa jacobsoni]
MKSLPSELYHTVSIVTPKSSEFDEELDRRWHAAPLWYHLDEVKTRILEGRYGFVVQLNTKRSEKRRKPEDIHCTQQPFDEKKFNFTKIDEREVLFRRDDDLIAINVSPLEKCHCLAIPSVKECLPQILTPAGLNLTLDIMFRSASPDLRGGFNSLGGFASVNHQHLHVYYLQVRMVLEIAPVEKLSAPGVFTLVDYPARGLVFSVNAGDRSPLNTLFRVVSLLNENNIAYNVFTTRGSSPEISYFCKPTTYEVIRIYLWARRPYFGVKSKQNCGFNVALCELAGHIPVNDMGVYNELTEETVSKELRVNCDEEYRKMMALLKDNNVLS